MMMARRGRNMWWVYNSNKKLSKNSVAIGGAPKRLYIARVGSDLELLDRMDMGTLANISRVQLGLKTGSLGPHRRLRYVYETT
jgi:hypothetical protein